MNEYLMTTNLNCKLKTVKYSTINFHRNKVTSFRAYNKQFRVIENAFIVQNKRFQSYAR